MRPPRKKRSKRIPFYRNVKTLGVLAQVVFILVILFGVYILYSNVTTALTRARLPADFGFLGARAGIPIQETPIRYNPADPYSRALLVGIANTLKVSLVGVLLATFLGIFIGVMRLSTNWMLRQIASSYVEVVRNTPLAVQIVFWFAAVLTPLPPRILNPIELPGGAFFSNIGLAIPWVHPSFGFSLWLPWLGVALALLVVVYALRKRQLERADRPGSAFLPALGAFLVVAAVGYGIAAMGSSLPENIATDFRIDRGRGSIYIDVAGTGQPDRNDPRLPFVPVRVSVEEGSLEATTQDVTESRGVVRSTFRFPVIKEREVESAQVRFADPEAAQALSIHYDIFPSSGRIFEDRNDNGRLDPGEDIDPATGAGFTGMLMVLEVEGFTRRVVADVEGSIRIPRFDRAEDADTHIEILAPGPLVMSFPSIPTSDYFGGATLTANYLALLLALVVYTSAFIAEIVRGGVLAVPKGQTEAAKAVGLSAYQTFSLVVFPQALRIIIPPMISQYLNLTKNSSLGTLAGYTELFVISTIIANQTGASVPVVLLIIASYLSISLIFAFILNIVNARLAIVER
jgi:His/Glu/Gln/Arg/opine family amino acid ABC transporter permease subunit